MRKILHSLLLILLAFSFISSTRISRLEVGKLFIEKKEYGKALLYFEELANNKSDSPEVLKLASICNSKVGNFDQAEKWAAKLVAFESPSSEHIELYFNSLVDNAKYKEAMELMERYKDEKLKGSKLNEFKSDPNFWDNHRLDTCFHKISRMSISSYRSELAPAVKDDFLYFGTIATVRSKNGEPNRQSMNIFYADIIDDPSTTVRKKTLKETNESFKSAYINFSKDGKTVFLTKIDQENKLMQLYYGKSELIKMDELKAFKYNSKEHSVGRATISPDGSKLVFSSNREGSLGQVDLWMCTIDDQEKLSEPINLGKSVNTDEDDVLPYFVSNDRLYFASEGHVGYGRFDIYYTDIKNGEFQKPVNLGNPVNTNADDMGISYSEKHNTYFFASDRKGNFDIYSYLRTEDKTKTELTHKHKSQSLNQDLYFSVQVLASRNSMDKAIKSFKLFMKGKSHEFAVVKEDSWLKFRTGHFKKKEQAKHYAKETGFKNYFVVEMSNDQIIQKVITN